MLRSAVLSHKPPAATSRLPWPLSDVTLFGGSERSEEGLSRSEIVVVAGWLGEC